MQQTRLDQGRKTPCDPSGRAPANLSPNLGAKLSPKLSPSLGTGTVLDGEASIPGAPARPIGLTKVIDTLLALPVTWRRWLLLALVTGTALLAMTLLVWSLSGNGLNWLDGLLALGFLLTLPWTAIGFWNAVLGLLIMRRHPDPAGAVCPAIRVADSAAPIATSTALLCCIRNEDAQQVARNLDAMIGELTAAGVAAQFQVYVLSDSTEPAHINAEVQQVRRLALRWRHALRVTYRRRTNNAGFKAGNVRAFCVRWGHAHDFALVLDADSLMSADCILQLVRCMQANPRIGILQTLMAGLPSASAFARPFQFGMRLGMRSYSIGSAWWQADVGPYWGHNALLRLAPFRAHCDVPRLPGRGPLAGFILSHDQVEAALMRRAGYEVRVAPITTGSWEENPPTLLEFIRRDLRWCQGNMQYLRLLRLPGLHPVSRVQLLLAILMFIASPAWVVVMLVGLLRVGLDEPGPVYLPGPGLALFGLVMLMIFAPKLATLIDTLARPATRRQFGGSLRLLAGSLTEVIFSTLLAPVMAIAHSLFLAGLPFGRAPTWPAQRRDAHGIGLGQASARLWPQTLVGLGACLWMAWFGLGSAALFTPFFFGALFAVPLAVLTAAPMLGRLVCYGGLWRTPDETDPAPIVAAVTAPPSAAAHRPTSRALLAAVTTRANG